MAGTHLCGTARVSQLLSGEAPQHNMLSKLEQASHGVLHANTGENAEQLMRGGNRPVRSKRGHRLVDTCVHACARVCTHAEGERCIPTSLHRPARVVLLGDRIGKMAGGGRSAHCVPTMCQDRQTRGSRVLGAPGPAGKHRPWAVTLWSRRSVLSTADQRARGCGL